MQLKVGIELQNGKYRIIQVLGQGGFGITYLAENILLGRHIAIKEFFPKDFCGRDSTSRLTLGTENNKETVEKLKSRFLKEAQNIAKLDHPNIVKIFDVFEENNTAYYVMDLIVGENLNEIVKKKGPLHKDIALTYIEKVGDALDYIHSRNMTHLDVKPANIVIREKDNSPILIDFGLSKQYNIQGEATSTFMHGISHGYSPIELYNIGSITKFTPQTDIYSLAATLYFVTIGEVPPSSSEILENGLLLPEDFDTDLKSIISKGMQPSRHKRPSTIEGLLQHDKFYTSSSDKKEDTQILDNSHSTTNENTQMIEDENLLNKTNENIFSNENFQSSQEYEEEEETKSQKILNWITGTSNLHYKRQIPIGRKIGYGFARLLILFLGFIFPVVGWLILVAAYKYLKPSLQRLFFQDYLHNWDDAYDYSKTKAIAIIGSFSVIPIAYIIFWIILICDIHKEEEKKLDAAELSAEEELLLPPINEKEEINQTTVVANGDVDKIRIKNNNTSKTISKKELENQPVNNREELTPINQYPKEDEIFVAVEQPAEFPGGLDALMKWLSQNIIYPETAIKKDIQGRVVVKFVVEKDGSIGHAEIARSVDKDLDAEALRVVYKMPKWKPGKNSGVTVRSYFNLPITFKLQND